MTGQDNDPSAGTRQDVAYVCVRMERIRADLQAHGIQGATPLERLVEALRAGADPAAALEALHEALLAAGDAAGIHGQARGQNPIGVGATTPEERVLLCPTGQCARYDWPDGPEPPRCQVSGRPLRSERL